MHIPGYIEIPTNRPEDYSVKYGSKPLPSGSNEYRFLFSEATMDEQGWEFGDYISFAYDQDQRVFGFRKTAKGSVLTARKLRRKDASRTGGFISIRGDLCLPEINSNTYLIEVSYMYAPCEFTLVAHIPEQAMSDGERRLIETNRLLDWREAVHQPLSFGGQHVQS